MAHKTSETHSLFPDLLAGFTAMLVALPSSIAFGVLTYTALGAEYVGMGAMAGLLGAAAMGLVAPWIGRTPGLISAPCAPSAAVLSAFIASLMAGADGTQLGPEAILPLLALTALLAAVFQFLYGALRGGSLIKFIPFPVVSGYLSAVGVLIALGQIPKILGLPQGVPLWSGLLTPALWRWESLTVGLVTIVCMALGPRLTQKLPEAILGLLGGIASYFALSLVSAPLLQLQDNPLVIGLIQGSGSVLELAVLRFQGLASLELQSVKKVIVPALTLSVLLSIDSLKTCVGLDNLTRRRHHSDRELMGQGVANLASFLVGGMPGAGTMGPSLVNVTSGAKTFRAGVFEGVFVVGVLLLLSQWIAWVPIAALAGIMLVIAWRMFDFHMFRLLSYKAGWQDFAVIAGVILVALLEDLIVASGVGIALSILLFIRDQIHATVVHAKRDLSQCRSKTRRLPQERECLKQHGHLGVLCELQGNLFFGTTDQLFGFLKDDLKQARYLLFDLRRVRSLDFTAVHLFEQMQAQLAENGGQLLFCGMPTPQQLEAYLHQQALIAPEGPVKVFKTLDSGLEWIEDQLLGLAPMALPQETRRLELADFQLFRSLPEADRTRLQSCVKALHVQAGEHLFFKGDSGDELFLVRQGSVQIVLPLEGGAYHHLATVGSGDFFGELAFLDGQQRSADVLAKEESWLYVLSRSQFAQQFEHADSIASHVYAGLATVIAERLREADMELSQLQDR